MIPLDQKVTDWLFNQLKGGNIMKQISDRNQIIKQLMEITPDVSQTSGEICYTNYDGQAVIVDLDITLDGKVIIYWSIDSVVFEDSDGEQVAIVDYDEDKIYQDLVKDCEKCGCEFEEDIVEWNAQQSDYRLFNALA